MSSWKQKEVAMWMHSMLHEEFPNLASFAILMTDSVIKQRSVKVADLICYMTPFVLSMALVTFMRRTSSIKYRFRTAFVYYQIIQSFLLFRGYFNGVCIFDLYASVIVMVQHELTPLHGLFANFLIIAKNTLMWSLILNDSNRDSMDMDINYFMGMYWAFFHFFNYLRVRKETLVSCFLSMTNLQREQQRLEALLQAIPDGVAVVTENREVVACNKSLLQQLQVAEGPAQAGDIYEALCKLQYLPEYTESEKTSGNLLTDILSFISRKNTNEDSFGVVTFSGVIYELRGRHSMWDQTSACVIIVRNITHWIDLERKAQRESASKTALLRSVSHELRTPTNVILNLARELQEHESLTQEGVASLQMMTSSTSFLLSIINDLLDYSRIITGNFKLTKKACHLQQVVRECIMLIQHQCLSKGVALKLFYDSLLPETTYTDQNRLKQVLLNLLSNAVKFTMRGTIELIALLNHRGMMTIRVKDSGIGIPAEDQTKIFRLFGKLEGNDSMNPQGCGLGLSISNHIVESLSGGHISVTSAPGKGSTFSFDVDIGLNLVNIPATIGDLTTDISEEESPEIHSPRHSFSPKQKLQQDAQVLIVDDADFNRIVARKLIEARGLECEEASTGLQAVRRVRERAITGTSYKLILMDVEMPEMDGVAATREIRSMMDLPWQPTIIGCSAYSSLEDRELSMSAGMNYYFEKPMCRDQLYEVLSSLLT